MAGMQDFYVRESANEGKRLPLRTPDGKPTEHWLQIRSQWSDRFREVKADSERAIADIAGKSPEEQKAGIAAAKLDLLSALVSAWSFEQPCTPEAVRDFLHNAPQIAQAINSFAGDDGRFFRTGSTSSMPGLEPSLRSGKSRKVPKSA